MSNPTIIDDRPGAASLLSEQLVALSGARRADRIIIADAHYLDLLIALTRRGFSHLSCQSVLHGPHLQSDKADIVFAPAFRNAAELIATLKPLGAALRCGGTMIVQITEPLGGGDAARLQQACRDAGFVELRPLGGLADGPLWGAHKAAAALARAA